MEKYEPHTLYAHDKMKYELAEALSQSGEVKVQTSQAAHTYEVYDKDKLIGKVHYRMDSDQVVEADDPLLEKVRQYFIDDFDKNLKKHEEEFKAQKK